MAQLEAGNGQPGEQPLADVEPAGNA